MTPEEKLQLALRSYAAVGAGPDVDALIPVYDPACIEVREYLLLEEALKAVGPTG